MPSARELNDIWAVEGGNVVARGDAAAIDDMLASSLEKVGSEEGGWTTIYRDRETNDVWELTYPQSHMHGGGPRRLRLLKNGA